MYAFLEDNRIHASFCVGVGHELSVIFSNIKDQAWSQHKHLYAKENVKKSTIEYLSFHRLEILQKW
jgi:hypothetical protein